MKIGLDFGVSDLIRPSPAAYTIHHPPIIHCAARYHLEFSFSLSVCLLGFSDLSSFMAITPYPSIPPTFVRSFSSHGTTPLTGPTNHHHHHDHHLPHRLIHLPLHTPSPTPTPSHKQASYLPPKSQPCYIFVFLDSCIFFLFDISATPRFRRYNSRTLLPRIFFLSFSLTFLPLSSFLPFSSLMYYLALPTLFLTSFSSFNPV